MRSYPLSEALEGMLGTARDWADAAAGHAATVAGRLDKENYASDADALAADASRSVALAVRGWAQLADAVFEAAVKIARPPATVRSVLTDEFTMRGTGGPRELRAVGGVWTSPTGDEMGTWRVTFEPPVLEADDRQFRMRVYANWLTGSAYLGTVEAVGPDGSDQVEVVAQVS